MAKPQDPKPQDAPQDVLVFLDSPKAVRVSWRVKLPRGKGYRIGGVTLSPGLTPVSAAHMADMEATPEWPRVSRSPDGKPLTRVVSVEQAAGLVAKTNDRGALEKLLAIKPLAQAAEAQLAKLAA